jgi:hypothetical protein
MSVTLTRGSWGVVPDAYCLSGATQTRRQGLGDVLSEQQRVRQGKIHCCLTLQSRSEEVWKARMCHRVLAVTRHPKRHRFLALIGAVIHPKLFGGVMGHGMQKRCQAKREEPPSPTKPLCLHQRDDFFYIHIHPPHNSSYRQIRVRYCHNWHSVHRDKNCVTPLLSSRRRPSD